jgi:selenocysteine lyase/cysteine desulfurase
MPTRRHVLGALSVPVAAGLAPIRFSPAGLGRALAALGARASDLRPPEEIAADEAFWFEVQQAFTPDRSLINLNNGGVSPSPAVVQEALKRHLDFSNTAPAWSMWRVLEPQREEVRAGLARAFGCSAEEVAITRNATESLQICQFGIDLEPGSELLATTQDYPSMISTFRQRERREKLVLKQFKIPVPSTNPAEVVSLYERQITPRTRLILVPHMINLTGQILPVREIVAMARRRGVPVLVDGAHTFAHFAFTASDLDCDYYATSLHKWLFAPHGTGMLYVRKDKIRGLWPLMASTAEMDGDIRKFEQIGTHPAANTLAIAEALTFHDGLGPRRKEARLRLLRDRWAKRLAAQDRVRLHTSLEPGLSCGIATFQIEGIDSAALGDHLWTKHRMLTTTIKHDEFEGLRITPSVFTTLDEIDHFSEVVEVVLKNGLSASA